MNINFDNNEHIHIEFDGKELIAFILSNSGLQDTMCFFTEQIQNSGLDPIEFDGNVTSQIKLICLVTQLPPDNKFALDITEASICITYLYK
jgi:hypothetical protein